MQTALGVATVCGSCKPLVKQVLNKPVEKQAVKTSLLISASLAMLLATLLLVLPSIPISQSVQTLSWDWLWTDSLARQISGFSILSLTVLSFLLSIRKRFPKLAWLSFDFWRVGHVLLTSLALLTLMVHTGISFGEGINRWLIINFLAIALVGIASAAVAAIEGYWVSTKVKGLKRALVWGHIITFWPLPILLSYHILSVYYF